MEKTSGNKKRSVMSSFIYEEEEENKENNKNLENNNLSKENQEIQTLLDEFKASNNPKYNKVIRAKKSLIDKKLSALDLVEGLIQKKLHKLKTEEKLKILREKVEKLGDYLIEKREEVNKRMDDKIIDIRPIQKILCFLTEHYEFIIINLAKMTSEEEVFLVGYDFRKNYLELSEFLSNN